MKRDRVRDASHERVPARIGELVSWTTAVLVGGTEAPATSVRGDGIMTREHLSKPASCRVPRSDTWTMG